ncbi:MAG: ketoacyl-ACP synthase III [Myxococcales bacterium]|nr:ketoacyl-ACP synthase III [Myxococcales bacterium]
MIGLRILGTATLLDGPPRSTDEVAAAAMPDRSPAVVRRLTGIATRHWIAPEVGAVDLAVRALRAAAERGGVDVGALRRVIFVTSTGGDRLCPANVNDVIHALGLDGRADGFDLNNACTGFLNGVDLAARCLATGAPGPVGVVVVETPSRFLSPAEPRPYVVFGDAAVAAIVDGGPGTLLGSHFGNVGAHADAVVLEHPERVGGLTGLRFNAGRDVLFELALAALQQSADAVLGPAGLALADVEWVVPHQPNGYMLHNLLKGLGISAEKLVPVVESVGSVGAASVAVGLDRLLRERPIQDGDHILLLGVGAGMSYGALLLRVGR